MAAGLGSAAADVAMVLDAVVIVVLVVILT